MNESSLITIHEHYLFRIVMNEPSEDNNSYQAGQDDGGQSMEKMKILMMMDNYETSPYNYTTIVLN